MSSASSPRSRYQGPATSDDERHFRRVHDEHLRLRRHRREQERLRRRLRMQLRRGRYTDAERTLVDLEITDEVVPILRQHADRISRVADRFRQLADE